MVTPEGRIKAGCLQYLKRRGLFVWNNPTGAVRIRPGRFMRFGKVGSSDILGCLPGGRFLAVEVKALDGRLSQAQQEFLEKIRGLGGMALVVRGWRELDIALRCEGYADDGPLFEGNHAAP